MASFSGATWHRLDHLGAIAPGYQADLLLLPDLERFEPEAVLKRGRPPGEIAHPEVPEWVKHTVRVRHVGAADLALPPLEGRARVNGVVPGQIVTEALTEEPPFPDPERDIAKIAVIERHHGTGRVGLGLVRGFGLRSGAIATTISHDAHNIVVIGVDDQDMARAATRLAELGGGEVVVEDRGVRAELPLPVAGLLSDAPLEDVLEASRACIDAARRLGCELAAPFQTMSFLALSVIPSLKITDKGLVDVDRFELVDLQA
jgi:adenine deaminase